MVFLGIAVYWLKTADCTGMHVWGMSQDVSYVAASFRRKQWPQEAYPNKG